MLDDNMKYPKINTLWKRDEKNKFKIMEGHYSDDEFKNVNKWHVTEKIDGTNIRIMFDIEKSKNWQFGGRTDNAQIPTFLFEYLQNTFDSNEIETFFPEAKKVILFGEGFGPKIQKGGGLYRDDVSFILFDVWIDGWWLKREDVVETAKRMGLESVPELGITTKEQIVDYIKSKPRSVYAKQDKVMEGIVARSHPLVLYRNGTPLMFKLKVEDYEKLEGV